MAGSFIALPESAARLKDSHMAHHDDPELPALVREIKRETEQLIKLFDQVFLRTCGVMWEEDIENPFVLNAQTLLKRFWPNRKNVGD